MMGGGCYSLTCPGEDELSTRAGLSTDQAAGSRGRQGRKKHDADGHTLSNHKIQPASPPLLFGRRQLLWEVMGCRNIFTSFIFIQRQRGKPGGSCYSLLLGTTQR